MENGGKPAHTTSSGSRCATRFDCYRCFLRPMLLNRSQECLTSDAVPGTEP